jgi:hypothetical protein
MDELEARMTALESEMRTRVTAVENQVQTVRADAAAARVLAGGADRDVSAFAAKLDAQKALLEALRETQVDQGKKINSLEGEMRTRFASVERRLDGLEGRFDGLEGRFDGLVGEMRTGFAKVATGQSAITTLLGRLVDQNPDKA